MARLRQIQILILDNGDQYGATDTQIEIVEYVDNLKFKTTGGMLHVEPRSRLTKRILMALARHLAQYPEKPSLGDYPEDEDTVEFPLYDKQNEKKTKDFESQPDQNLADLSEKVGLGEDPWDT